MARTVVNLREDLLQRARRATGLRRKVDVVNEALRRLVDQDAAYRALRTLRGKVRFRGDGDDALRERHDARR